MKVEEKVIALGFTHEWSQVECQQGGGCVCSE